MELNFRNLYKNLLQKYSQLWNLYSKTIRNNRNSIYKGNFVLFSI